MAPSMEGGFLPPLGLKISLTFADERNVQEVLNTQFQLFTAEEDIQSFLLDQVSQLLQSCMKFSGGLKDAEQIHQKLQGLQTLSRTGVVNLHPAPKTCLFLGSEEPVRRTNSDPERSKRERCVPPTRSAKSEETLTAHEQSTLMGGLGPGGTAKETKSARSAHRSKLVASLRKLWNAEMERRKESQRKQQSHSQECRKEKVLTKEDLIRKPSRSNRLLPTIDEQPEGSSSTTDYSDGDESEGSDDDFADFAEVPEDLPALAPPIAGVVNHTPAH